MTELKPGWQRVKFGEVVRLNKESCKDPAAAGIERVIGLEHLEPGDLRVRSWADVADGTTFTNRVRPGQVLFGKRRAYQRKVAVADFNAVCSGDIYVLESTDPKHLLPNLLPYLCQTDAFFEHAVGTSAGSLSPRTNWKSLSQFELVLPPLEEQRHFLSVVRCADTVAKEHADAHSAMLLAVKSAYVNSIICCADSSWKASGIDKSFLPDDWDLVPAEEICSDLITKGATPSSQLTQENTGIPFYKVYNLTFTGALDFSVEPTWITPQGHRELSRSAVRPGDVLMNIVGPPLGKVSRVPDDAGEGNINQEVARFRAKSDQLSIWLESYLLSPIAQTWLALRSKKTSGQKNLTLETCRELPIPIPPDLDRRIDMVKSLARSLEISTIRAVAARAQARISINQVLSEIVEHTCVHTNEPMF
jgi:type I restriction enzyme S subunit